MHILYYGRENALSNPNTLKLFHENCRLPQSCNKYRTDYIIMIVNTQLNIAGYENTNP